MVSDLDKNVSRMYFDEAFMKRAMEYYLNEVIFKTIIFVEEVRYEDYTGGLINDKPFKVTVSHTGNTVPVSHTGNDE